MQMIDCNSKAVTDAKPRVRSKSEEKRTAILAAASDLFLAQGFDDVNMVAVAESAGVSKQTVYSHFGSKDELFSAAIDVRCQKFQLIDMLEDLERPMKETLTGLAHQFDALINSYEGLRIYGICAANNVNPGNDSHISELFWQAGPAKVMEAITDYFTAQQDAGRISLDNPKFAGQQFLFMLQAEENMRRVIGLGVDTNTEQQDEYLCSCVELFCRGYGIE